MVSFAYVIKDVKLSLYMTPFFCPSETHAVRSVAQSLSLPNMQLNHFAEDFELYELGEYDDITGKFKAHDNIKFITSVMAIKTSEVKRLQNLEKETTNA